MPTDPTRVRDLFHTAVALPPAERPAYLAAACPEDTAVRAEVEALLAAHDRPDSLLSFTPAPDADATAAHASRDAGAVLGGKYKLLELIGEGGMGSVWMAEQRAPVKRLVSVKLIKPGMDSVNMLARFEAERQALALMDHPNIARIFDAGASEDGRPYFVMELVKGVPITAFCDDRRLTPRQRLELFVPVCQAVQHAHQKGVIHRDIKPSNILVAVYDDKAVPKVIDFGVAKAAGAPLTDQTLHTGFGTVVGTLEYMSPEQATFNQLDVDTRTDVYALGVVLYELLAGGPPFRRKELQAAGLMEMLRVIREVEPQKPSAKLSTADTLPTLAASRSTEPRALAGMLRGDLDWIVMRALEKDRGRRYESASGMAKDVERYLAGDPVDAAPPSAAYRLRKFARRHRAGLAAAAVFTILLLAATGVSTVMAVRARAAEARARADRQTARESAALFWDQVVSLASPLRQPHPGVTVADAVKLLAARLDAGPALPPLVDAYVRRMLGELCVEIMAADAAEAYLSRAHDVQVRERGPDDEDAMAAECLLIVARRLRQDYPAAAAELEGLHGRQARLLGADHPDTLYTEAMLGETCQQLGRHEEAERRLSRAANALIDRDGVSNHRARTALDALARFYVEAGAEVDADAVIGRMRALGRQAGGDRHPAALAAELYEGMLRLRQSRPDAAAMNFQAAVTGMQETHGPWHPLTATARLLLVIALQRQGRFKDAAAPARDLAAGPRRDPQGRSDLFYDALDAYNAARLDRPEEGLRALRELLPRIDADPVRAWRPAYVKSLIGDCLAQANDRDAKFWLIQGFEGLLATADRLPAYGVAELAEAGGRVVKYYEAANDGRAAATWRARVDAEVRAANGKIFRRP